MAFAKDFLWGTASASAQVEGGWNEGGRTPSIWDALIDGHIKHDETPYVACDTYHHTKDDAALMGELGLKSYRFSISWPRVIPAEGKVNPAGVAYYSNLVDELLKNGVTPMITLYHWDLPMWVYRKGGWLYEGISDLFADYAKTVAEALGDRVEYWLTLNEPQVFVGAGYNRGTHAPFLKVGKVGVEIVTRNVLLAHGKAAAAIRKYAAKTPKVGFAPSARCYTPAEDTPEAIAEAKRLTFEGSTTHTGNIWWESPIVRGEALDGQKHFLSEDDLKLIHQPLDFFGVNVYQSRNYLIKQGVPNPQAQKKWGQSRTQMDWAITPEVLYWMPKFYYERYGLPILITENGLANCDVISLDGAVHDPQRIDFITRYLAHLKMAVDEGVPVIGYQYWSLFDNFEWDKGYSMRFGLLYTDYANGCRRVPKDSASFYSEIIRSNGENLPKLPLNW